MNPAPKYVLYGPEFRAKSQEVYAEMRRRDPIVRQVGSDGQTPVWFFTRYEDVDVILRDKRFVRDAANVMPDENGNPAYPEHDTAILDPAIEDPHYFRLNVNLTHNHLLNKDGEAHRRLRSLISQAFTQDHIERLRPNIQMITDDLIQKAIDKNSMEVIADFASQLPTIVILEMLGIPIQVRKRVHHWANDFLVPTTDEAGLARFQRVILGFTVYMRALLRKRRKEPRDDLITSLVQANVDGESLSEEEICSTAIFMIFAGHETSMNLIGNSVLTLTQQAKLLAYLKEHPEEMKDAVEEFLRFDSPVERLLTRFACEDVNYKGHEIKRGDMVAVVVASANHDEALFDEADSFKLNRHKPHLSFGRGMHYCLGAPLARVEAEIALNTLIRRLPNLRLAIPREELSWHHTPHFKALERLPLDWDRD